MPQIDKSSCFGLTLIIITFTEFIFAKFRFHPKLNHFPLPFHFPGAELNIEFGRSILQEKQTMESIPKSSERTIWLRTNFMYVRIHTDVSTSSRGHHFPLILQIGWMLFLDISLNQNYSCSAWAENSKKTWFYLLLLWLMVLDLPWGTEREGKLAGTELDPK